jgi:threonine/homoserine/homoserine lactone efflux protein
VVKFAGAGYLIALGVRMLRSGEQDAPSDLPAAAPLRRVFRDGLLVALLNPKTTIFFAAFLPQFVDPSAAPMPPTILLGSLFVATAAVTDTIYALAAGSLAPKLRGDRSRRVSRRVGGSIYIGLGLATACAGSRPAQ